MAQLLSARTGAVVGSISAGANSAGGALAGALPHRDVGGARVERPGRDAAAMLSAPLRAYVLVGVEPEADSLAGQAALEILSRADRVVAITAFATEAMRRYGHVLLPAGTAYETSGTFVNCEGRWQGFSGSASPVGEARPAWKILRVMGTQLGLEGFDYQTSADVVGELKSRLESDAARKDDGPDAAGRLAAMEPMPDVELPEVPMYGVDGLVRRSRPLQETAEAAAGRRTYR